VKLSDERIAELMAFARRRWPYRVRLQITAGWGCTVIEFFECGEQPSIPLRRELVSRS